MDSPPTKNIWWCSDPSSNLGETRSFQTFLVLLQSESLLKPNEQKIYEVRPRSRDTTGDGTDEGRSPRLRRNVGGGVGRRPNLKQFLRLLTPISDPPPPSGSPMFIDSQTFSLSILSPLLSHTDTYSHWDTTGGSHILTSGRGRVFPSRV